MLETYKGEVQLSGFVDSAESQQKAVALGASCRPHVAERTYATAARAHTA